MLGLHRSQVLRALRRYFFIIIFSLLLCSLLLSRYRRNSRFLARDGRLKLTMQFENKHPIEEPITLHEEVGATSMTVHLVVAATSSEDISWTSQLKIPGLKVIHYIADNPSAAHHPPANKGHEVMMYHSYFYDFYDQLPDIAILTHAQDISWHMESILTHSLSYALSHLDLLAVKERGYVNLRVSWENACPAYIDTTFQGMTSLALESQATREAFLGNFGHASEFSGEVPRILAQPCCSQFAVTRDVIRSVKRESYAHYIDWLLHSTMDDSILGRTWEHMFQWLFTKKAVDCPVEWKTYCIMYHICFESREKYDKYMELDQSRADLIDRYDISILKALWTWGLGNGKQDLVREIGTISEQINELKRQALERGRKATARTFSTDDLYEGA
jgi:hypothetical protein